MEQKDKLVITERTGYRITYDDLSTGLRLAVIVSWMVFSSWMFSLLFFLIGMALE